MDERLLVDQNVRAFKLGLELAECFRIGMYDALDNDELGSFIGTLICQRVLRDESGETI